MRIVISFASLFLSVILVQLGSGALGPLDALSGAARGFSTAEIGLLGSVQFVGFFIGCWVSPRLMGTIGHSRTFAAFAAAGAVGAAAHPLYYDPYFWAVLRLLTGLSVAGAYTVLESWLQAKIVNADRGRAFSVYRFIDLIGSLAAQMMIGVLEPAVYVSYNIIAIIGCLCVLPLTLTQSVAPPTPDAPRLRPGFAFAISPLGCAGVFVSGLSAPAFRMVGPVYGDRIGLDPRQIALFLGIAVLAGALVQLPMGWLADKIDRRKLMVTLSALSALSCGWMAVGEDGATAAYLGAAAFGFFVFPIYSIASAHANDFAPPGSTVELNTGLIFMFALGAVASPLVAAMLIEIAGPGAMFGMIATAHGALIVVSVARMAVRPSAIRTPYRYLPRTTLILGRLIRQLRK